MDFIGKYSIIKPLQDSFDGGRKTFLVADSIGEKFVIKQFRFAVSDSNWSSYKSLEKEIQALESLDYPTIPRYIESFESDQGACLVMQHIPGGDLSGERLNLAEVKEVVNSILDILIYLQSQSPPVVHRDIKPQNIIKSISANQGIFLLKKYQYCLIDFGLAIETASTMSFSTMISGTPGFMPPELFRGIKLDKSADLYSLAVTVFCLLTGKSATEVAKLVDSSFVLSVSSLKSKVSGEFIEWLERCLNPDPLKRFSSAKQAQQKFKQIDTRKPKPILRKGSASVSRIKTEKNASLTTNWIDHQDNYQQGVPEYSFLQRQEQKGSISKRKTNSLSFSDFLPVFYSTLVIILIPIVPLAMFYLIFSASKNQVNNARENFNTNNKIVNECSPNLRYCLSIQSKGNYDKRKVDKVVEFLDIDQNKTLFNETGSLAEYSYRNLNSYSTVNELKKIRSNSDAEIDAANYFVTDQGNLLKVALNERLGLELSRISRTGEVADYLSEHVLSEVGVAPDRYYRAIEQGYYEQPITLKSNDDKLVELDVMNEKLIFDIDNNKLQHLKN